VCSDDPQLTVRAVPGANPVRVLLDPNARIPTSSGVLSEGGPPTLWLVGPGAGVPPALPPHVEVVRLERDGDNEPASVLAVLHARGLGRVLVEGGGRTVSRFLAAGQLDRLYLTTAPLLIGDGVPGVRFGGCDALVDALRGPSRRFRLGEDVCTELVFARG
jgi:3,4-dihydroxy 2-butanone 4-phosphate synthase/GTP cyclohydrolase II